MYNKNFKIQFRTFIKTKIHLIIFDIYKFLFLKKIFFKFNKLIFDLSVRGLGILNHENSRLSGEDFFIKTVTKNTQQFLALDIGANVGTYSNKIKKLVPQAKIYAFEPHPNCFKELSIQAIKYDYTAINLACSDTEGQGQLYDYPNNQSSIHASLYKDVIEEIHQNKSLVWNIQITTIDEFVELNALTRINLLKIDTEGNEYKVLQGAKKTIESGKINCIHFEFNWMNVVTKVFLRDFKKILPNYRFYRMLPDGLISLDPYDPIYCEIFRYQNIVAIHEKSQCNFP